MSGLTIPTFGHRFPSGLGASARWQLPNGRQLTLFVIDATVPLYNVVIGSQRFFANQEQIAGYLSELGESVGDALPVPTWQWVFETGFEKSVDGARVKQWCLLGPENPDLPEASVPAGKAGD